MFDAKLTAWQVPEDYERHDQVDPRRALCAGWRQQGGQEVGFRVGCVGDLHMICRGSESRWHIAVASSRYEVLEVLGWCGQSQDIIYMRQRIDSHNGGRSTTHVLQSGMAISSTICIFHRSRAP